MITIILLCVISIVIYLALTLGRVIAYKVSEEDKIPKDFYLEVPYDYNVNNHFCIKCQNGDRELNLIVDTKAMCMMKDSDIERNKGIYFGKSPVASRNSHGQKIKSKLYYFPNFRINDFSTTPLFKSITRNYYPYYIINDGILGNNMLSICSWKFSVDDKKVKLFSNKDTLRLQKESKEFIKIENGLTDNGIKMIIGKLGFISDFTLDLGQSGEFMVTDETAAELKKYYSYKVIQTLRYDNGVDSLYLFEGVPVEWNGIKILNCQIGNRPGFVPKQNYIGAKLMHRFNFILSYIYDDKTDKDLYIQPCKNFDKMQSDPIISEFGINIENRNGCLKVVRIERGGVADRNGIQLGNIILQIDSCVLNNKNGEKDFIQYVKDRKRVGLVLKDKKVILSR